MHRQLRGTLVLAATGGLLALTAPAARAAGAPALPHYVDVIGNGHAVTVSHQSVEGGPVTLRVSTTNPSTAQGGGSSIVMFRLQNGATLPRVFANFGEEFGSNPAKGTRDLTRDALFTGLADPTVARPILVTERLSAGIYYLIDIAAPPAGPPAGRDHAHRQAGR